MSRLWLFHVESYSQALVELVHVNDVQYSVPDVSRHLWRLPRQPLSSPRDAYVVMNSAFAFALYITFTCSSCVTISLDSFRRELDVCLTQQKQGILSILTRLFIASAASFYRTTRCSSSLRLCIVTDGQEVYFPHTCKCQKKKKKSLIWLWF